MFLDVQGPVLGVFLLHSLLVIRDSGIEKYQNSVFKSVLDTVSTYGRLKKS